MKFPMLIVFAFALIVVIIPISVVTGNSKIAPLPVIAISSSQAESSSQIGADNISDAINISPESSIAASMPTVENISKEEISPIYNTNYFNILNLTTGKVEKVSVRDYVVGAVAAEMPPSFHSEALKAQAVAAHTYALRTRYDNLKKTNPSLLGADFACDPINLKGYMTEKSAKERYGDMFDAHWSKITQAVDSVLGEVLTYNGQPIVAAYHASSAGNTEDAANVWVGSADYLKPVESQGDILSPGFETTVTITSSELKEKLSAKWNDVKLEGKPIDWINIRERSESGYVVLAEVGGIMLHGKDIRTALDLRSSAFEVSTQGDDVIFTVFGYGHGVGLSQYGADYMARQGSNYLEILSHYYSGADLSTAPTKK